MGLLKLWLIHNGFSKTLGSYTMGLRRLWAHTLWVYLISELRYNGFTKTLGLYTTGLLKLQAHTQRG